MFPPKKSSAKPKGLDSPSPIGGKAPMPPMPDEPDADDMGGGAKVKPEAVMYHEDERECQMCQYMDESGNCQILGMQVSPVGGCNAFEAKAGGEGSPDMSAPPSGPAGGAMYGGQ